MSQILDELEEGFEKGFNKSLYWKLFFLILAVISFGVYVGDVLFGKSSLEVMLELEEKKITLQRDVKRIKREMLFCKRVFELKQLEPEE